MKHTMHIFWSCHSDGSMHPILWDCDMSVYFPDKIYTGTINIILDKPPVSEDFKSKKLAELQRQRSEHQQIVDAIDERIQTIQSQAQSEA